MHLPTHDEARAQAPYPCPLISMSNPIAIWAIGFSDLCLLFSACETVPTKTYQIRQRAFTYNPAALIQDYQEEYAGLQLRFHQPPDLLHAIPVHTTVAITDTRSRAEMDGFRLVIEDELHIVHESE
jgi:hypothetical protein